MNDQKMHKINDMLKVVGVTKLGLLTPESKVLVDVLHDDEIIGGVVYGKYTGGLAWLVATNKRIIFIDKKPFFTATDELSYDIVSGVKSSKGGMFASVILHTRLGDYTVSYVNIRCAKIFINFIENKRLENNGIENNNDLTTTLVQEDKNKSNNKKEAYEFLRSHDICVLSTIDRNGNVHGAIVNYAIDQDNYFYIMTKSETNKGRNIYSHNQVALTVHEAGSLETVQLQGLVSVESNKEVIDVVSKQIIKARQYKEGKDLPPVTKLKGDYMVLKIQPYNVSYHNYSKS